ncbi:hypothetical protein Tco_0000269 [Tanacetum coccineum]
MKRTHPSVQVCGSGSVIVSKELNTFSTLAMPLNVTPLITEYPISDDDEPDKFVVIDVTSVSKPDKKRKKAKAKKIIDDASVTNESGTRCGGSGVLDSASQGDKPKKPASSARAYLESILLHTRVAQFLQWRLYNSLASFDHALIDIAHAYAYLRSRERHSQRASSKLTRVPGQLEIVRAEKETIDRVIVEKEKSFLTMKANKTEVAHRHSEEVVGLQGRIAELEIKVRRVNDNLAVTAESSSMNYDRAIRLRKRSSWRIRPC